ncbi:hypothetical protein DFH08DRAFT_978527 [Mycena albidolilacea]|uniref:Uncharacterized protein n=1 Tax=Mycena albidolilacea TaxID=1033008 RepID=A0AAD6YYT5_9AGAR|nr:hypothetical protein DFH08DRAFT_978527 [Mycena albidolilacea]
MPAARALRTICPTCGCQGNALCRTNRCKTDCHAHSTVLFKVHNKLQPPAAQPAVQPSVPRPPPKAAFNTPQCLAQLTQDHSAQQQERAACLAALAPLPPSPTRL